MAEAVARLRGPYAGRLDAGQLSDVLLNLARLDPEGEVSLEEADVVLAWITEVRDSAELADLAVTGGVQLAVRGREILFHHPDGKSAEEIEQELHAVRCPLCARYRL